MIRSHRNSSSIEEENSHSEASHYEIKWLLDKRVSRNQLQYLVKWLNYDNEHNVWYFLRALNNVDELITKYEVRKKEQQIIVDRRVVNESIVMSKIVVVVEQQEREREKSRDRDREKIKNSRWRMIVELNRNRKHDYYQCMITARSLIFFLFDASVMNLVMIVSKN